MFAPGMNNEVTFVCPLPGFAEGNFALVLEGPHSGLYGEVPWSVLVPCVQWECACVCVACCTWRVGWLDVVHGACLHISVFVCFMIFIRYS